MAIMNSNAQKRLSFGSKDLDEMVGGGLIRGTASLVSGAPGVGKTTLGLQFLIAGIKENQPALLVSFEEFPASLIRDALQLGWDLKKLEKEGLFRIIFTSPEVFLGSLKAQDSPLSETLRTLSPERVVLDSAAHFQRITNNPVELRDIYNTLVNALVIVRRGGECIGCPTGANGLTTVLSRYGGAYALC